MFIGSIKSFLLKKSLKRQLYNVKEQSLTSHVLTVGLIVDESQFVEVKALKQEIIDCGIDEDNIKVLAYRNNFKEREVYSEPTFGLKHLNLRGEFKHPSINEFVDNNFDLLISYYSIEKPFLLYLTHKSKAKFKVGFSSIDKRLNHLLINISIEDFKGFIQEVFRFIKILNKKI